MSRRISTFRAALGAQGLCVFCCVRDCHIRALAAFRQELPSQPADRHTTRGDATSRLPRILALQPIHLAPNLLPAWLCLVLGAAATASGKAELATDGSQCRRADVGCQCSLERTCRQIWIRRRKVLRGVQPQQAVAQRGKEIIAWLLARRASCIFHRVETRHDRSVPTPVSKRFAKLLLESWRLR